MHITQFAKYKKYESVYQYCSFFDQLQVYLVASILGSTKSATFSASGEFTVTSGVKMVQAMVAEPVAVAVMNRPAADPVTSMRALWSERGGGRDKNYSRARRTLLQYLANSQIRASRKIFALWPTSSGGGEA